MSSFKHPPVVDINTARADSFIGGGGSLVSYEPDRAESALTLIEKAEQALGKASTIDVVKGIRDQAEVLRLYAKQAQKSFETQNQCAEIKLRAERKAGHMLIEQEKNKGAAVSAENADDIPRLKDIGISYSQSSRWQAIAGIPEAEFEQNLDKLKEASKEITSAAFLRLATNLRRDFTLSCNNHAINLDAKLSSTLAKLKKLLANASAKDIEDATRTLLIRELEQLLTSLKSSETIIEQARP